MVNCRRCEAVIEPDSKFCKFCGQPLMLVPPLPPPRPKSKYALITTIVAIIVVIIVILAIALIVGTRRQNEGNGTNIDSDRDGYNDDVDDFPNDPEHHEIAYVVDYDDVHVYADSTSFCADFSFPRGWCRDFDVPSIVDHIVWNWLSEDSLDFKLQMVAYPDLDTVYSTHSIVEWDSCEPQDYGRYIVSWTIPSNSDYDEIIISSVLIYLID